MRGPEYDRETLVQLIDQYEQEELVTGDTSLEIRTGPGRKQTPRGRARRRVATQFGLTLKAVSRYDRGVRMTRKHAHIAAKRLMSKFETFGLELDPAWVAQLTAIAAALHNAERQLSAAAGILTKTRKSGMAPVTEAVFRREVELIKGRGEMLRRKMPRSLCPFCKGQDGVQEACKHCDGAGWVGKLDFVPAELLEREPLRIHKDGEVVTLGEELDW